MNAMSPPPHDGKQVLAVFRIWGSLPGEMVPHQAFSSIFARDEWRGWDLDAELAIASGQGWIEQRAGAYRLTSLGFEQIDFFFGAANPARRRPNAEKSIAN